MKNYKQNIILMSLLNENKTIDFLKNVSGVSNFRNAKNSLKNIRNTQQQILQGESDKLTHTEFLKKEMDKYKDYMSQNQRDLDKINHELSSGKFKLNDFGAKISNSQKNYHEGMIKDYEKKYKKAENLLNRYTRRVDKNKSNRMNQISDLEGAIRKDIAVGGLKSAAALAALAGSGYAIKKIVDWRKKKKKEEKRKE